MLRHTKQVAGHTDTHHTQCAVVEEVVSPMTARSLHGDRGMDLHLVFGFIEYFARTPKCRHNIL